MFTPTRPARFTFVERESINDRLVAALSTPGKQVVIYGHSGSGKTTLLVNKLHQLYEGHITTRCFSGLTFELLVLDAFDRLGSFYEAERTDTAKRKVSASLQSEYLGIRGQIGAELSKDAQAKRLRVLPPQLTPQTLAMFLGEAGCCWVLEDFHKIDRQEKKKLSQVMKLFMDMSDSYSELRIIAIGAVDTARQVVEYDAEMRNRVSEILVPLMTEEEISEIPEKGEELLNVRFLPVVKRQIVQFSDGLASVCHQLCLNICFAAGFNETLSRTVKIDEDIFAKALEQYVEESSDTLKAAFDKAFRQLPGQKLSDGKLILRALVQCGQDGATREEILVNVKAHQSNYTSSTLSEFLRKLQTPDRGGLIRYDQASGRYSFSENIYRAYAATYFERERQKESKPQKVEILIDSNALLKEIHRILERDAN